MRRRKGATLTVRYLTASEKADSQVSTPMQLPINHVVPIAWLPAVPLAVFAISQHCRTNWARGCAVSNEDDYEFFKNRVAGKTYLSKVFDRPGSINDEKFRFVRMIFVGSDEMLLGEIEGALCLRLTGEKRKTQVSAIVTSDHKGIRRVTLETFKSRAGGWYEGSEKEEFTFRGEEFARLLQFLEQIMFIDPSNQNTHQIEDIQPVLVARRSSTRMIVP